MGRYFTHYWRNDTWRWHIRHTEPHARLVHTASGLFRSRGVAAGGHVYVVTVIKGVLHLCAKMEVAAVCGEEEAARLLGWERAELWRARDHAVAARDTAMRFDLRVPSGVTGRLGLMNGKRPLFKGRLLDPQTFRGVRELTPASAAELDALLPRMRAAKLKGAAT